MSDNTKKGIKVLLSILVFIVGIAAAVYFGLWVMFIKSILMACAAFDAGILTATMVGWTIIKCLLASTVATLILWTASKISLVLLK